jgi:hypothetical protein
MKKYGRVVLAATAATSLCAAAADAQTLEGSYRGTFVCEKIKVTPDILHVPLDLTVRGDAMQFARPRFNLAGTRVIGSELAFGNVEPDGKLHLTSEWYFGGVTLSGDYTGTLTPRGGTLTGTQTWRGPDGAGGSRQCTAALVEAPKAQRLGAE